MKDNIIVSKVENFTNRIIKLVKYLRLKNADPKNIEQLSKSGTSIGANISESIFAQSRADFVNKLHIALKEANETAYWIRKFHQGEYLNDREYNSIIKDNNEIIYILIAIIKTTKEKGL